MRSRGKVVQYDKALGRDDAVGPFGSNPYATERSWVLSESIDLTVDRKWVQPRLRVATIREPAWEIQNKSADNQLCQLDIDPHYNFGKKRLKGVVITKTPTSSSRIPMQKEQFARLKVEAVDVKYGVVKPNVKGIVAYQRPWTAATSIRGETSEQCILEPNNLDLTRPRRGRAVDMSKCQERWPISPLDCEERLLWIEAANKDKIALDLALSKISRTQGTVHMAKDTLQRFVPVKAKSYLNSDYDTSNQQMVLSTFENTNKSSVNMAKNNTSRNSHQLSRNGTRLELDVENALRASSKSKRVVGAFNMAKQSSGPPRPKVAGHVLTLEPTRWTKNTARGFVSMTKHSGREDLFVQCKENPPLNLSPHNPTTVLSEYKRAQAHVNMSKSRGREAATKATNTLETLLSPKAAAALTKKVAMCVQMAKVVGREGFASKLEPQTPAEELHLSPKGTSSTLSKYARVISHVNMGKSTGRSGH
ncbi:hypothetical protein DYB30_001557 [Aphanomyces astaci]|uniref:Uncharacterized protein n=1 Tax=Aphanomyces astaci TaxID=112090 RepID=A0A397F4L1_APHAT|nr:hypothetical protein DYB30_001557 [Aphanomyces astaci]RHZ15435.1 hypothetical protein DYB31_001751 [Aphanomyces astaci]RHZ42229.1 hypothetical protein DYB26_002586 [Aphanomyces astaci]